MSECSIRDFKPEDLQRVCEIELSSFSHPYPCQLFLVYHYLFPSLFLVAECGSRVVGYVVGVVENGDKGHLTSIAVDREYRGRGLGKSLIREFEVRIKSSGVFRVYLEVSVRNEVAISLYKKLGYRVV
ncbi:MAG: GNAT family N-acetyltransferase, partial [Sulfolobales archaeon]|nr:GNAT family N-acetyltransferase [Sulfolobales archaeon]